MSVLREPKLASESTQNVLLILNVGSATIKFQVFSCEPEPQTLLGGTFDHGVNPPAVKLKSGSVSPERLHRMAASLAHATDSVEPYVWEIMRLMEDLRWRVVAVGHRVVHGGEHFQQATLVDENVIESIARLIPCAPLHQAESLSAMKAVGAYDRGLTQVACFDTAFHANLPLEARSFAIPRQWSDQGVRRYGFHGLSFASIAQQLSAENIVGSNERTVIAHLGSGSSICGLVDGVSQATTMGMTPLDGVPMATRCGGIDPGAILYLINEQHVDSHQLQKALYCESGLKGLSQLSGDMRVLLASEEPDAKAAVDYFVYWAAREIASIAAAIEGLDVLVFSGGIGEHSSEIRRRICQRLAWLDVMIDPAANNRHPHQIHLATSRVRIFVFPANEEKIIVQQISRIVAQQIGDSYPVV